MSEVVQQLTMNLDGLSQTNEEYTLDKKYIFRTVKMKIKIDKKKRIQKAKDSIGGNVFNGKTLAFIGKMSLRRDEILELAEKYGARATETVSKYTDVVVVGKNAGENLKKTNELELNIILEEEFWNIITSNNFKEYIFKKVGE